MPPPAFVLALIARVDWPVNPHGGMASREPVIDPHAAQRPVPQGEEPERFVGGKRAPGTTSPHWQPPISLERRPGLATAASAASGVGDVPFKFDCKKGLQGDDS